MELPNIHFQDFPIEFKEINPDDFPHFEVGEKIVIRPNEDGFINEQLQDNISLETKDTVVINAPVGFGKSYSIIQVVQKLYHSEQEYLIFIASPFVSLVEQYYNEIISETDIPESQLYKYNFIGENNSIEFIGKKVQIITVNTLLGNPGEDAFINSEAKRNYLNTLVQHCKDNNIKAVFIYDEIHDAFHNFKEKYVFNLWKWKDVIHKNLIISATYCEASKVVIEYLGELTDNKIRIIECERIKFPDKQSGLYLHYDHGRSYSNSTDNIVKIVGDILDRDLDIDILTYSKKLSEEIYNNKTSGVGELLYNKYGENISKCVSELVDNGRTERGTPTNRYKNDKANIGTNFKTGVSIEKENHAFVIILPPSNSKGLFKNYYGIFSNGINSIIQALARKRTKGEIHIILPRPEKFDYDSLPFSEEIKKQEFIKWYNTVQNYKSKEKDIVKYLSFTEQETQLSEFYFEKLRGNVIETFEKIEEIDRVHKTRLEFPEYKLFKLEDGEDYLSQVFPFCGKDLSAYVTYCAFTNQFVNCNLVYINIKPAFFFNERYLQYQLGNFFENYFNEDWINSLIGNVTNMYAYHEIKNEIFSNYTIFYKTDTGYKLIEKNESKFFESQLIGFIQRKLYPNNIDFASRYVNRGFVSNYPYTRADFLTSCITHSNRLLVGIESLIEPTQKIINAYQSINYFRNKMIDTIQNITVNRVELRYLKKFGEVEQFINDGEIQRFKDMIKILIEEDYFIKNEIFDFRNNFERSENRDDISRQINAFYNCLKTDFFSTEARRINNAQMNENVTIINSIVDIPNPNLVIDFISPVDIRIPEENLSVINLNNI